jgi:pyrroline-5-carboxylate reductase
MPILVVGGGKMGEAIVAGLLDSRTARPSELLVAEPDEARRVTVADAYGVRTIPDAAGATDGVEVLILAVKPQVIDEVIAGIASGMGDHVPLVVSIAAGVPTARLEGLLPRGSRVVRVMPNTPAMVGEGVSAVSPGSLADDRDVETTVSMFATLGEVVVVDEALQDAVTAISGSGPAYMAIVLSALRDAGRRHGLDAATALALAVHTMKGTAILLEQTDLDPEGLVDAVSSPGGTTMAARGVLDAEGFGRILGEAVDAAFARARELGRA